MAEYLMKYKNRQEKVSDERIKNARLDKGWAVINKKGEIVEPPTGGITYTAAQYNKLVKENQKLKKQLAKK